jgi:hypothetical protein
VAQRSSVRRKSLCIAHPIATEHLFQGRVPYIVTQIVRNHDSFATPFTISSWPEVDPPSCFKPSGPWWWPSLPRMDGNARTTLILVGVFALCSASLMVLRLAMRRVRGQDFTLSDYLTIFAIACVASRTGFAMVIVLWGNNNLSPEDRASILFTTTEIYRRVIGSKLTLVDRVVYNT